MEGAGLTVILGLLGALWAASGYVGAFSRAMNRIYEVTEGRPFWRMRPMQIFVTVTTVVLCATALVILIVSGPVAESVGNAIGVGDELVMIWDWAKWPVLALVVMVIVALLYYATPNVDFTRFRVISVGAFVAILVWLVASIGFAFYVANFGSYNKTYGSVAGVVIALLWLWITNLALLFGAELDAELERGRQLQLGVAAEETLQLPVRDTRGIQKAAAREAQDLARMRELRLASTTPGTPQTARSRAPDGRRVRVERVRGEASSPVPSLRARAGRMTRSLPVTRCRRSRGRRPVSPGWQRGQPCRSWTPGSPCARHVRGWSPGASRWPATSVRRTRGRATGAARSQDGAIPSRRCWWSVSRLLRTAATAPAGSSRATGRATGCSPRSTGSVWRTSRPRCTPATGCN